MTAWLRQPVTWGYWLVSLLAVGLMFGLSTYFVVGALIDAQDAKDAASRQQEGRAVAIDVLCGFSNGVADAGRKALAGELKGTGRRRGVPQAAQDDYVKTITSTLRTEAGVSAADVLQRDGSVDCRNLREAARATHTKP